MKKLLMSFAIFLSLAMVAQAQNYQIKLESGVDFNQDLRVEINHKAYDNENFYGGRSGFGEDEKYGWDTMAFIDLNEDKTNLISFVVTQDASKVAEKKYIPVLFRVYKDRQLFFSIVGAYSLEKDIGKKFSLTIPPLNDITEGKYFFYNGIPSSKVIVVTTGFANCSFDDGKISRGGIPADLIWVSFIEEETLPAIGLKFDDKARGRRPQAYPFYITQPYFCYADVNLGVIYQQTLEEESFKTADTIYIRLEPTKFQLIEKVLVEDKELIAKVEKLVWPTLKETAKQIEELNLDFQDSSEDNKKKVLAIIKTMSIYIKKIDPVPEMGIEMSAFLYLNTCPKIASSNPQNFETKVFNQGQYIIAELFEKKDMTYPAISLVFKDEDGTLVPLYPFKRM